MFTRKIHVAGVECPMDFQHSNRIPDRSTLSLRASSRFVLVRRCSDDDVSPKRDNNIMSSIVLCSAAPQVMSCVPRSLPLRRFLLAPYVYEYNIQSSIVVTRPCGSFQRY